MLSQVEQEKTPLTRQLDQLTVLITIMAAIALALVVIIGLIRGDDFDELFLIGISLAIAAIPTGLPAVVTTMLSLGTQALAAKGAIVKRLRSVETLGATSAICSDKTGTLTLNQMTARELVVVGPPLPRRGRGLLDPGPHPARGRRDRHAPRPLPAADGPRQRRRRPRRRDRGRPDRGARSWCWPRRAASTSTRRARLLPRIAEVPFDSEYKFMATFHDMEDGGRKVVRCFVKGAPDVLLARSSHVAGGRRRGDPDRRRRASRSWRRTTGSPARACA